MPPKESKIQLNPITVGIFLIAVAAVVLIVMTLAQIFRKNPYGPETKIDNINIVGNLPQLQKDQLFSELYTAIDYNLNDEEDPPKSGALVREGTVETEDDPQNLVYYRSFIIDVASVRQSFEAQISWSPTSDGEDLLGGYPVLITCAPRSLRIYEDQVCSEVLLQELSWENTYQLDYTFGATISQKIQTVLAEILVNSEDENGYTATVDEISLKRLREQPDITYQYDVIYNGKKYTVITRIDETYGNNYVTVYVNGNAIQQGIILMNDEVYVGELSSWLKELSSKPNLEITTQKLNETF